HKQKYADEVMVMERQLPKNVRQIGNVSDSPKVYVEDYVDTFFNQLCDKADNMPLGAFLIGEMDKQKENAFVFGAIQIHDLEMKGNDIVIGDDAWKTAFEECKHFFDEGEIIGWFVTIPGLPMTVGDRIVKSHEKAFSKKESIFVMKDPVEKEEIFYAYKLNDLMDIGGHYIYYEKNPSMQNYMISTRRQNGVTPSEAVEDRAAKNFRSLIRTKGEVIQQKSTSRFTYVASGLLILLVVAVGIITMNNYDKMKSVQTSLETITKSVSVNGEKGQKVALKEGVKPQEPRDDSVSHEEDKVISDKTAVKEETTNNPTVETAASQTKTIPEMEEGVYVVQKGDTLAIISKKSYGDTSHVDAICKMNGLSDGNLIFIGQKLVLP
ncbi:MAG: LysM domain-containing protein, partial [Lachnospiraceae bacterium]